ncbi:SNF2 family N-terminal domain-containing protein [Cokeromyces recurvatus]|uniref:SNF2 family N-terminal domain-containing protein n=1 Tax=Cokeromyces recurvatus TaxID=90255 RepID=UPI002220903A|nr:SNF2 family N-terminal domain-containing protein [Cokeromyces recurvatus]KAI7905668.1 SNF2 family N-terminal domain-containing protein [Cokeromyces recurvatus]
MSDPQDMVIDRQADQDLKQEVASPAIVDDHASQVDSDIDSSRMTSKESTPLRTFKECSAYETRLKRYRYLLGQTELFAHFLKMTEVQDEAMKEVLKEKEIQKLNSDEEGSRRRRKTEKEEDEEILKDEQEENDNEMTVFTQSPTYVVGGTLREYQIQGLNWMISLFENGINGILADEMGLGKTLQTISFLGYLKHVYGVKGPHLVVVPKSTLHNWHNEFSKWIPNFDAFIFHGDKEERNKLIKERLAFGNFEVCITSYEICLLEKAQFKKVKWQYIIIDEAHRIKNENSMLSQLVRILESKNRLLITGTPLQNNLHELWALLNFLLPDVFSSSEVFDEWFEKQGGDQKKVVEQLHKVLRPFLLRRIKSDVEKSLLPKKEINIYVRMTPMQRQWYQKILEKDIDAINGVGLNKREGKTRLLNIVMQLRKCCNHPYLFDGAEPGPPFTTDQHLVDNCGKMVILDKLLKKCKAQGSRVLLFSQMSRVLDILEDYCWWKDYQYCRIDGQTSQEDRIDAIDEYNKPGSDKFIFLLTTRAGGLGINLTTADVVILYDSDWNPQVDLQAMDRAHRIGQTKQVYVFRFVTENAIEEKILERAAQKLRLDQLVIQQGRMSAGAKSKAPSKEDLLTMIQHGADSIFKDNDNSDPSAVDDIDEILRHGEEKTAELNSKYSNLNIDDLKNFTSESAYKWDGEDWSHKRKAENIGLSWLGPAKRERKANYAVDDYYKEALRTSARTPSTKAPRPKKYNIEDFQFFPSRLAELNERDTLYLRKSLGYKIPPISPEEGATEEDIKRLEEEREEEQKKIDNAEPLTEEEEEERKKLFTKGFSNWGKKDFAIFINACSKYGRNDLESITNELEGKTLDEVKKYSKVFWSRYKEISDYEKHVSKIEKGESELEKQADIQSQLTEKVRRHRIPLQQLKIHYTQPTKGKNYTEEEDRFLVVMLEKYGYGSENVYDNIRREIKQSPLFRFDWFLKSRTSQEIARRCNTLISLIQKENSEFDETEEKKAQPPKVHNVQRQLLAIFDPENLKKDNFFRELVEKDPEHWVPIKKLSMIKRFKEILEGDLGLFEKAVSISPNDFEMNEAKTHLRYIRKEEEQPKEEEEKPTLSREERRAAENQKKFLDHIEQQNKRSIYAKGFNTEEDQPSEAELKEFYGKFGRVLSVRLRREGNNNRTGKFKGSIFVEFELPEIAQKVVEEATEYKSLPLLTMIKADYVEMKKQEKFGGAEYEGLANKFTHRHLIEYSNGQDYGYKDIKELVKTVAPNVGRLEPLDKKGCGVIELYKMSPEEFLEKLTDHKIESINFFLASSTARAHFNKIQKEALKHGHNGRGRHNDKNNNDDKKRKNDNTSAEENNKRARTIIEVATASVSK